MIKNRFSFCSKNLHIEFFLSLFVHLLALFLIYFPNEVRVCRTMCIVYWKRINISDGFFRSHFNVCSVFYTLCAAGRIRFFIFSTFCFATLFNWLFSCACTLRLPLLLFFCFVRQMFEYAIKDIVIIITNFWCCCCWFMSTRNTLGLLSENEASELIRYTIESAYCENNDHENNETEGHFTF